MNESSKSHRLRRLDRVFDSAPSYFLTFCTEDRAPVLANDVVMCRAVGFCAESFARYGVFVDCYVLMPDHVHLIVTVSANADITIGAWVKAFKAMVARHAFRWQSGFFDHVLRSDESRSEKWEYIRENPVRAGLVDAADVWPYAQRFNRLDGSEL